MCNLEFDLTFPNADANPFRVIRNFQKRVKGKADQVVRRALHSFIQNVAIPKAERFQRVGSKRIGNGRGYERASFCSRLCTRVTRLWTPSMGFDVTYPPRFRQDRECNSSPPPLAEFSIFAKRRKLKFRLEGKFLFKGLSGRKCKYHGFFRSFRRISFRLFFFKYLSNFC